MNIPPPLSDVEAQRVQGRAVAAACRGQLSGEAL